MEHLQHQDEQTQSNKRVYKSIVLNTVRPEQNGQHFAGDNIKNIFLKSYISIQISLKLVPEVPIDNKP